MSYNTGIVSPIQKTRGGAVLVDYSTAAQSTDKVRSGASYSPTPPGDIDDRAVINPAAPDTYTEGPSYGANAAPFEPKSRNPVGSWSFVILPVLAYGAYKLFAKPRKRRDKRRAR